MLAHKDQLIANIVWYHPAIILLSESRTTSVIDNFELEIADYSLIRCDSNSRHTGGIVIYVRKDLNYTNGKTYVQEGNYWCKFVSVNYGSIKWIIGSLYHSPSGSHAAFIDQMENICEEVLCKNSRVVLAGDFNLDFLSDEFYVKKIKDLFHSYGICQKVETYTRITNTSKTLIDYVLTNIDNLQAFVMDEPKLTDHSVITVKCFNFERSAMARKCTRVVRNLSNDKLHNINLNLIDSEFLLNGTDVNDIYNNVRDVFGSVVNEIAPKRTISYYENELPWYDDDIKKLSRDRDNAYKIFKSIPNNINWESYKHKRNAVVNLIKEKKNIYYYNEIDKNVKNPKLMWKTLKKLINPKQYNSNFSNGVYFENNGQSALIRNNRELSEHFNEFFVNSISDMVSSIEDIEFICNIQECENHFSNFKTISLRELGLIIKNLENKGSTIHELNSQVVKNSFDVIGHVWCHFVNTSLETGVFPEELKTSIVTPVEKITNTNKSSEFRPINSLPFVEKLLESVVYQQLLEHIESNNLLFSNQSGFRSKHSCESAIQLTVTKWKNNMSKNLYTIAVSLDLRRAFETVNRKILLKKLKRYGIGGKVLNWIKGYLTDRKQVTKIGDTTSPPIEVKHGVPQGSILGPLLFLVYINDIDKFVDCDYIHIFADDTLISVSDENLDRVLFKINSVLRSLNKYLKMNKLKLNVNKSKAMIITTPYKYNQISNNQISIEINNEQIEIVKEIKYLGFMLDNHLLFSGHFEYIKKKILKKLYFFSRVSQHLSLNSRITVYKTIIQPHFEYCPTLLYFFDFNKMSQLQKLQNRAMRIILRCNRMTPISMMLQTLDLLKVERRLYYLVMTYIYKMINNLLPTYFCEYITFANGIHTYNTRSQNNLYVSRQNHSYNVKSLFFKGFIHYNGLPENIKKSKSLSEFKRTLTLYCK